MTFSPAMGIIHFIGIGGIGMSGLALILNDLGFKVTGSDQINNTMTQVLKNRSIPISDDLTYIDNASLIVISSAIKENHPGLSRARQLGLTVVKRSHILAEIMRTRFGVAVAGTHGKTTVTSLIGTLLLKADLDPTIVSGGILNDLYANARLGKGQWIVAEADESDGSFVHLPHTIGIVTNIEPEHMDYYETVECLIDHFQKFLNKLPFYGLGIVASCDIFQKSIQPYLNHKRFITYGLSEADVCAKLTKATPMGLYFDLHLAPSFYKYMPAYKGQDIRDLFIPLMGEHNMLNATAAFIAGLEIGINVDTLRQGLQSFQGVKRRFNILGSPHDITVIDDYAHHPTEIKATIKSAKQMTKGRVIAIIEPHRYSRTLRFLDDFLICCKEADMAIIIPIYAAGEAPLDIDHHGLREKMRDKIPMVYAVDHETQLHALIKKIATPHDSILCMGAGSITHWAKNLTTYLETPLKE